MQLYQYTGVILAGGKSSRMGSNKAFSKLNNKSLIEYLIEVFKEQNYEIIISGNKLEYGFLNYPVIEDNFKNIGPLASIESGLKAATCQKIIFSSCDTPFIDSSFLKCLEQESSNYEVVVPVYKNFWQPMNALYSKKNHLLALELINKGQAYPKDLIRKTKFKELHYNNDKTFFNINTLADLEKAQQFFK